MSETPITRAEKLMSGDTSLKPITREEMFLAKAAGIDVQTPEPITRREKFLSTIAGFGQGGGGDVARSIVDRTVTEFSDSEVTTIGAYAFYNCTKLTTVNCPNVTKIGDKAFNSVYNNVPLVTANLPSVTEIGASAFEGCRQFTTGNWQNVTTLKARAFVNTALTDLYFPSLVTTQATQAFLTCTGLTVIPRTAFPVMKEIWVSLFEGCSNLTRAEFDAAELVYQGAFRGCTNFKTLVLRCNGVAPMMYASTLEGTAIASGTGYVYVPSAHVDGYKTATNWSVYADQIRAIEDYTVDGTVDGDLDESKI